MYKYYRIADKLNDSQVILDLPTMEIWILYYRKLGLRSLRECILPRH